ncbi:MAG: sugar nucleotide-binding protein [Deltaproteobacteria bacterium]|nr:sugar nucleotide-binding protein [Deltaproteobacteria bacterium]
MKILVILPVSSDYFQSSARRPYFSAMSNAKISDRLGSVIPDWENGIDRYVERLKRGIFK